MAEILTEVAGFGNIEPPIGMRKSVDVVVDIVVGNAATGMLVVTGVPVIALVSRDYHHHKSPSEFLLEFPQTDQGNQ